MMGYDDKDGLWLMMIMAYDLGGIFLQYNKSSPPPPSTCPQAITLRPDTLNSPKTDVVGGDAFRDEFRKQAVDEARVLGGASPLLQHRLSG